MRTYGLEKNILEIVDLENEKNELMASDMKPLINLIISNNLVMTPACLCETICKNPLVYNLKEAHLLGVCYRNHFLEITKNLKKSQTITFFSLHFNSNWHQEGK